MSKITRVIDQVKEFSRTPAGQVATSGISYMGTMALAGAVMARFFPGKATFGRALAMGIYAVGMQTIVGSAMTGEQQQRLEWAKECHNDYRRRTDDEMARLRKEISALQERLSSAETELAEKTTRNERKDRAWKADMDGTVRQLEKLRAENAELRSDVTELRKERECLLAMENGLRRQLDELNEARKSGVIYPRPHAGEEKLEKPDLRSFLESLLNA